MSSLSDNDIKVSNPEIIVRKDQVSHLPPLFQAFVNEMAKIGTIAFEGESEVSLSNNAGVL